MNSCTEVPGSNRGGVTVFAAVAADPGDCSHPAPYVRSVPLAELRPAGGGVRAIGTAQLCDRCALCISYTEWVA